MLGRRSQRDFEDEIHAHLQLEIDRLRALGMSPAEAERRARRNFGNEIIAGDRFYRGQRFASAQDVLRDMRHAWRSLLRSPGFLAATVVTLALAIGATAGMFNVVNTVLLEPLPYPDPGRLVAISGTAPGSDLPERFGLGSEFYLHYRERSQLLSGVVLWAGGMSTFRTDDRVERIPMAWLTNDVWPVLGVEPALGRLPRDEEGDGVAVISDQLWSSWFGRDPAVIGRTYFVSDGMKQVVGVMPPQVRFPRDDVMLWIPTPVRLENVVPGQLGPPLLARVKPGITTAQLELELTRLSKELPERFGGSANYARFIGQHSAVVEPLDAVLVGRGVRASLWVLLGAVGVVLLIACANVANLFLVRAESRRRDVTVRRALGASRAQLVRFQLAESFAVALAAGLLAMVLSTITLPLFIRAAPEGIPRLGDVGLDLPTLVTAFGLVVFIALACGTAPALRASSPDMSGLREGGRGSTGRRQRGRDLLVVSQTALALVLLIGAALLVQSFQRLRNVDPGYDIEDIYTFQYAPQQPERYYDGPTYGQLHLSMMERLRALPGVTAVGLVNNIPLDEGTGGVRVLTDGMASDDGGALVDMNFAGGDYFAAMGISLLHGRAFTRDEHVVPNTSVIVSRSVADRLWPGQDPLGRRIRPRFGGQDTIAFSVVGVVEDVKQDDWRQAGEAVIYFAPTGPMANAWGLGSPAYVVKSPRADQLRDLVREAVREVAPEAPVYREYTMESLARRSMTLLSFTTLTLGVVSVLALILGAVGLYGVLSYVVGHRTREIGVRMALGATAGAVRRQVVSQGAKVVLLGVAIGVAAALVTTRFLERLLYGVRPVDPVLFAAMSVMMIGLGALASYMPARRASSVDPIEALKTE